MTRITAKIYWCGSVLLLLSWFGGGGEDGVGEVPWTISISALSKAQVKP